MATVLGYGGSDGLGRRARYDVAEGISLWCIGGVCNDGGEEDTPTVAAAAAAAVVEIVMSRHRVNWRCAAQPEDADGRGEGRTCGRS